jgi:hypothetical protein
MKKVFLSALGFAMLCRVNAWAQTSRSNPILSKPVYTTYTPPVKDDDTSDYRTRQLHIDEVNLVSSYYDQNGDHSAVTAGIGTQKVTDVSNTLEVKLVWLGNASNRNTITGGLGIDHHTSASSAYVTLSGQGKQDGSRLYPSFDYTHENPTKGTTFGLGSYYSGEYNYKSFGADMHFSLKTKDRSGEFSAKLQAYWDQVVMIYPAELVAALSPPAPAGATYVTTASGNRVLSTGGGRTSSTPDLATSPRNTYTASFAWSQIINSRLQLSLLGDVVQQTGFLSLPYHRVYFSSGKDTIERLPSSRFKLPIGARLNYFAGDNIILRTYYRYYTDNWGTHSNTASFEVSYKVSPFFSLSPFYRYYDQSAAKYFGPYKATHCCQQLTYFSSNYELAASLTAAFLVQALRLAPPKGCRLAGSTYTILNYVTGIIPKQPTWLQM